MQATITPLLMFEGQAEAAMSFYVEVFADSQIEQIERYQAGEQGTEGTVRYATFHIGQQLLKCMDSSVEQPFTFTPAISLLVECKREEEIDGLFARLSDDGRILMSLGSYPFARRFGWLTDRFGVSWQLLLA